MVVTTKPLGYSAPMMNTEVLPSEPMRARVKVERANGRTERLGRITVTAGEGTVRATTVGGEELRSATVQEVQQLGQNAWVVLTTDGDRWTIMAGGCGCGGG